jgi:hypothetical protein
MRWRYALVSVACVGIAISLASNMGVCVPEGRMLLDQDYFKAAINEVIHDPVDGVVELVPGAVIHKSVHSQRYSDVNQFLSEFPECCKFVATNSGDGGPEVDIWDRMRGVRTAEISYDKRYAADDGAQKSARVTAKVAVTSCGVGRPFR